MSDHTPLLPLLLGLLAGLSCGPEADPRGAAPPLAPARSSPAFQRRSLEPVRVPPPVARDHPARLRPLRVVADASSMRAWVTLSGTELYPGSEVLVVDLATPRVLTRIQVGSSPAGLALHPSGRWLLVTNRFSNFLSVIDTGVGRVVAEIPVPFYCEDLVLDAAGTRAYVSNSWKDQVLLLHLDLGDPTLSIASTGPPKLLPGPEDLGLGGDPFLGELVEEVVETSRCARCGWVEARFESCPRCSSRDVRPETARRARRAAGSVRDLLRARCGTAACHMQPRGGFYAGADDDRARRSALAHLSPGDPDASVLLRSVTPAELGGFHGRLDGRHHPGGVVFPVPDVDPDFRRLQAWIREGVAGPGIPVGSKPRDLLLSSDGGRLYVANTGSGDVSVIDVERRREVRRIWAASPVNDLASSGGRLVLATLGVGSGHPKQRDPRREAWVRPRQEPKGDLRAADRAWIPDHPAADLTVYRVPAETSRFPLMPQDPLGPFDAVDGTLQEGPRDISNDVVLLDPQASDVSSYRATETYTRYTSDSFEALPGDEKGDVASELMKVVGAFPEQVEVAGDRFFVSMAGTSQVQEWRADPGAEPALRLTPGRVFETGLGPAGLAVAGNTLLVADRLGDTLTFVDLETGAGQRVAIDPEAPPYPATDHERGEVVVATSLFSADQDQSCVHCHYRDTGDGKRWSNMGTVGMGWQGEERFGGSRQIPDMRTLNEKVPFLLEGIQGPYELVPQIQSLMPLVDFQGVIPAGDFRQDPAELPDFPPKASNEVHAGERFQVAPEVEDRLLLFRRHRFVARVSTRWLGKVADFDEIVRLVGVYLEGETRLLPNPVDPNDPMVIEGQVLFESPEVGCAGCHPAPSFTDKVHVHNANRAFPPLVSRAPRDDAVTLLSANYIDRVRYGRHQPGADEGRIEETEGHFVAPSLRGLWARPPSFLHHGHAVSLREVVCTPDHMALRRYPFPRRDIDRPGRWEVGKNEREGIPDTHGGTSHLSVWEIECLLAYLLSIE